MAGPTPQQTSVPNSDGTKVVILSYVFLAITLSLTSFRVTLNKLWKRKSGLEDCFLLAAVTLSIAQTVLTHMAVNFGLGQFIRPGDVGRLVSYAKFMYSSDLLFILVLAASMTSVVCMLQRMYPSHTFTKRLSPILHLFVGLWTTFSMIAIAFQCHISMPWLYVPERCLGSGALWYSVLIGSIKLNLVLAFVVWPERKKLSVNTSQQRNIALLFSTRISVCIALIIQIIFLAPALRGENQPRQMVLPAIMRQIVMNLSILAAARLSLYRPLALLDQIPLVPVDAKELSDMTPPATSSSSRRFDLRAWKDKISHAQDKPSSSNESSDAPRLTLTLSDHNERRSRSVFSECFSEDKRTGSGPSFEQQVLQGIREHDVEAGPSK